MRKVFGVVLCTAYRVAPGAGNDVSLGTDFNRPVGGTISAN
jgi:hypothetical protein